MAAVLSLTRAFSQGLKLGAPNLRGHMTDCRRQVLFEFDPMKFNPQKPLPVGFKVSIGGDVNATVGGLFHTVQFTKRALKGEDSAVRKDLGLLQKEQCAAVVGLFPSKVIVLRRWTSNSPSLDGYRILHGRNDPRITRICTS